MKAWLKDIVIAVAIAFIVLTFVKPTIVKQSSMEPTLHNNDYMFLSKQAYRFGEPKRGDIIVFHTGLKTDVGKEKMLIKRIIGLPGDVIDLADGKVYLNGEELEEDYLLDQYTDAHDAGTHFEVPDGHLFAMGDNRGVSMDSRYTDVGFVPVDAVIGKALIKLYPFNEITLFN